MPRAESNGRSLLGRVTLGVLFVLLVAIFLLWRIDSPRVEQLRVAILERVNPIFTTMATPVTAVADVLRDFRSYAELQRENRELREQLRQLRRWREKAIAAEARYAQLLALNKVRLDPRLTHVTARVKADSGSPFSRSVLINVGRRDGIRDGWAAMDGLGLVGRIAGTGETTARVLLITDATSRIPVTIANRAEHVILTGDNSPYPLLDFVENPDTVRPGDRVVTSGDGGLFPAGLPVGTVALGADKRLRVIPLADLDNLEFLRILRSRPPEPVSGEIGLAPDTLPATSTDTGSGEVNGTAGAQIAIPELSGGDASSLPEASTATPTIANGVGEEDEDTVIPPAALEGLPRPPRRPVRQGTANGGADAR